MKNFIFFLLWGLMMSCSSKHLGLPSASLQLERLQDSINEEGLGYTVRLTSVAGKSIDQITGEIELTKAENDSIIELLQNENDFEQAPLRPRYIVINNQELLPNMKKLDLRDFGLVTPVRDQGNAGSCWAFGTIAAFESNYNISNSLTIDGSEQYLISCSGAGSAKRGGLAFLACRWMVKNNIDDEASNPYRAEDIPCQSNPPQTNYFTTAWSFVDPSGDPSAIPSVEQIKDAMCRFGVISASVYVDKAFQCYDKGVFRAEKKLKGTNHAISIIGWDDEKNAWLIKNSWGAGWGDSCGNGGDRGYMWIDYNSNNIGRRALWIQSKKIAK